MMVQLPDAAAVTRTAGFLTLASGMSPFVRPEDPLKDRKLADLEKWTQCGVAASAMIQKPANQSEDAFQKGNTLWEPCTRLSRGFRWTSISKKRKFFIIHLR